MPRIVVLDWSLDALVRNQIPGAPRLNYIEVPPFPIQVVYEVSQTDFNTINNDPLLNQIMRDEYTQAITKTVKARVIPRLVTLDNQAGTSSFEDYAEQRASAHRSIEVDIDKGITDGDAAFAMRLQRLEREKSQYKGYRRKVGKRVASAGLGVAGAAVGVAATVATYGAALPLAIVGLYRAVMDSAKLIRDCWLEAEQCEKNVVVGLFSLSKTYGHGKSLGRARELGVSITNAIIKFPATTKYNANGATIQNESNLWKGKLTHLRYLAHDLSKDLEELLEKSNQLSAALGTDPSKAGYLKAIRTVQDDVNLLLTQGFYIPSMMKRITIQDSHRRAERGLEVHRQVDAGLSEFISARGKWVDKLDFAIDALVNVTLMAATLGVGGAPVSAMDKVSAGVGNLANADVVLNTLYEGAGQFETTKHGRDSLVSRAKGLFKKKVRTG